MRTALKALMLAALLAPAAASAEPQAVLSGKVLIFVPEAEYAVRSGESPDAYRARIRAEARELCSPENSTLDREGSRVCEAAVLRRAEGKLRGGETALALR